MTDVGFDLISAILIFVASIIPIYFSIKLKNTFRIIMVIVSIFTLIHGTYHILEVIGQENIAENIVEPISYIILIIFGVAIFKINVRKVKVQ